MGNILTGQNRRVLRLFVAVVVLGALWLHWRAAYISRVRAALGDLPAASERLDDLVEEHVADALERIEHLERFAPLRRWARQVR
jgi:hypothetical protein